MRGSLVGARGGRQDALRSAVEALPVDARQAMLAGLRPGRIIAGAYSAGGGVCPALAAYRQGAETDFSEFALAWDRFVRVRGVRRASPKQLSTLASLIEHSL